MIFLYSSQAKNPEILLDKSDENFLYLTKVKRSAVGDTIVLSNLEDEILYTYKFSEISKREIVLEKIGEKTSDSLSVETNCNSSLHIIWGICDFKTLSKTLPFLNEMGVEKITFLACERTQGNFMSQLEKNISSKLQKILEQSCQQCGRNSRMILEISGFSDLKKNISLVCNTTREENIYICDFPAKKVFPENILKNPSTKNTIIIGPEGGFSPDEKTYFQENFPENIYQFNTNNVLRSETAVSGIVGKFLL